MGTKNLFEAFNPVSAKEWKQKIQFDLKGADYNETLVWESPEGIKVKPFYHSDDAVQQFSISKERGWHIGQALYAGDAGAANIKAKEFLTKGAESIVFQVPSEAIAIATLLEGIDLKTSRIYLNLQFLSSAYINTVADYAKEHSHNIYLNNDLLGNLAKTGNWFKSKEEDHKELDAILAMDMRNTLTVDTTVYQNAGANRVQQLAYGLAHANEYLNHLGDAGMASQKITFKIAVGTNYFFEIAKLRAFRILWGTLAKTYGSEVDCHIIAQPTRRNKTLYDYNTNMLRTTTECMSAVLGGSDTVVNMPYDGIYHKNNEFGDRISLNQLVLLKNESYFDKVDNAANGSYYIEELTQQLAQKALVLFKSIEKGGGFLKQLMDHTIQKKIAESAAKEQSKFKAREEVLVGTNVYSNPMDKMKGDLELFPFVKTNKRKTLITPIISRRLAEEVEQKRLDDE